MALAAVADGADQILAARRPRRIAVMICSSVQLPMPVSRSGVMLDEYTVPNGPSYFRPPALTGCFGTVWQPQPPVAPNMYLPRAISAAEGGCAVADLESKAGLRSRSARTRHPAWLPTAMPTGERRSSRSPAEYRSRL